MRDRFRRQIARAELAQLALEPAEIEEQLLLRRRRAHLHERAVVQDVFLHRCAHPPHRVGGEAEAALRLELRQRLHQADVAFRDQVAERQAIAAKAPRDLDHQTQMAAEQLACRLLVPVLPVALGKPALLLGIKEREARRLLDVRVDIALRPKCRQVVGHRSLECKPPLLAFSPAPGGAKTTAPPSGGRGQHLTLSGKLKFDMGIGHHLYNALRPSLLAHHNSFRSDMRVRFAHLLCPPPMYLRLRAVFSVSHFCWSVWLLLALPVRRFDQYVWGSGRIGRPTPQKGSAIGLATCRTSDA